MHGPLNVKFKQGTISPKDDYGMMERHVPKTLSLKKPCTETLKKSIREEFQCYDLKESWCKLKDNIQEV
jgi:hypothetical protein